MKTTRFGYRDSDSNWNETEHESALREYNMVDELKEIEEDVPLDSNASTYFRVDYDFGDDDFVRTYYTMWGDYRINLPHLTFEPTEIYPGDTYGEEINIILEILTDVFLGEALEITKIDLNNNEIKVDFEYVDGFGIALDTHIYMDFRRCVNELDASDISDMVEGAINKVRVDI